MNKKSVRSAFIFFGVVLILVQCNRPSSQFTELKPGQTGLDFRNDIVETEHNNILTYEYTYNGAGVASGDINGDGLADLYFSGNSVPNKLFLNKGNWRFEDITSASGTAGRKDWKSGVTMADVNGDGWLDIYVCYSGNAPGEGYNLPVVKEYPNRANQLFINNGCTPGGVPSFTERAREYGLDAVGTFSTQAYFFDYDRDGDLDMFLLNHANMFYSAFFNTRRLRNLRHPYFGNKLYRNDTPHVSGNAKQDRCVFTEVSATAGFHGSGLNFGLSAAISDLNFDGWPDIYVTNDYEEQDFCYINNRDGTFTEASHKMFAHLSKFGMGSDIADMNNDGLQDILVLDMLPEDNYRQKLLKGPDEYDRYALAVDSGYHHQYMRNTLQLNRGFANDSLPRFSEIGQLAGISNTDWSWTPFFVDLDNDGLKDIFITNGYPRDFTNLDFMKYTGEMYEQANSTNQKINYLSIIQQTPQTRVPNYAFKNEDGLNFTNITGSWGLDKPSVSNGAVYADLDNDGDYDIVTNELNDQAAVWRNNHNEIQKNNYVKIKLKGKAPNTYGIGAKIIVSTDSMEIFQEVFFTRGYASSVEPVLTVGIGESSGIKSVMVEWPDGHRSHMPDVKLNQTITIDYQQTHSTKSVFNANPNALFLKDITDSCGLIFKHKENKFVDFKTQRLLVYQLSRLGGKLAIGDVNGDSNDDVYFGGAAGQSGALFFGEDNGSFYKSENQVWEADSAYEDIESVFFDADNDNDLDLYVVSGGSEFSPATSLYQDRLYLNDGKGAFVRDASALPDETTSGSCVAAADFDRDGDQDLFVGGRHSPGSYGLVPRSFLLRNDSDKKNTPQFSDATAAISADLMTLGMVTDAIWTDFNNDKWPDLIVVGEWMPIRVFENRKGKLVERKDLPDLKKSNGWWCNISAADIDNDGDMDYFLGNAGSNMQFKASAEKPVELFAGDFNDDGVIDPLISYYIKDKPYPLASRDELLDQVATLRKKFVKYEDYARADISTIADKESIEKSYKFKAYLLESCWLENIQGEFKLHKLPLPAQFSSVNGFLFDDFNNDNARELLYAGNFFPYKPQLGQSDASMGGILKYMHGDLSPVDAIRTGLWLSGDIRDIAMMKFKSGKKRVILSRNNDIASVFSIN